MISDDDSFEKKAEAYRSVAPYLGLGFQLAATITIFFFLGYWLDIQFDTEPLFIIVLTLFGGFSGIYYFIKTVLTLNKKKNEKDNNNY